MFLPFQDFFVEVIKRNLSFAIGLVCGKRYVFYTPPPLKILEKMSFFKTNGSGFHFEHV